MKEAWRWNFLAQDRKKNTTIPEVFYDLGDLVMTLVTFIQMQGLQYKEDPDESGEQMSEYIWFKMEFLNWDSERQRR